MNPNVIIRWIPSERGGRSAPPTGQYRGAARFEDSRGRPPDELWTVRLTPVKSFGEGPRATLCEIEFLSPEAGQDLLTLGARFSLCEGRQVVAKGVVLPSEVAVPQQIDEFAMALLG